MLKKIRNQGLILAIIFAVFAGILSTDHSGPTRSKALIPLILTGILGLASVACMILQRRQDKNLAEIPFIDMPSYRAINWNGAAFRILAVMIVALLLLPYYSSSFRSTLFFIFVLALFIIHKASRNLPFINRGYDPQVLLKRSVLQAMDEEKCTSADRTVCASLMYLSLFACLSLIISFEFLKNRPVFPAMAAAVCFAFFCLALNCSSSHSIMETAKEFSQHDFRSIVQRERINDRNSIVPWIGTVVVLAVAACTGVLFHEQDLFSPLRFELSGANGYTVAGIYDWSSDSNSISIPEHYRGKPVTAIKSYAFQNSWITHLDLPASIQNVGDYAFAGSDLESVIFRGQPQLEEGVFSQTKIQEIKLPESMETIPDMLFYECWRLEKAVLPVSIKHIGAKAFSGCTRLLDINLPSENVTYGEEALSQLPLTEFTLPSNMDYVPSNLLYECRNLESLILHDGVAEIGESACYGCKNLTKIILPAHLEVIHKNAFGNTGLTDVNLPEGILSLGAQCFKNTALSRITLPASLKQIHEDAFAGCANLSQITFLGSPEIHAGVFSDTALTGIVLPEGTYEIRARMFAGCTEIRHLELPETIRSIGAQAFMGCSSLTEVEIPASVREVHEEAFSRCTSLSSVSFTGSTELHAGVFSETNLTAFDFPEGTVEIHARLLANCKHLASVRFPESLESIGANAFSNCEQLEQLVFPKNVKDVHEAAFLNCTSLKNVVFQGCPELHASVFSNCGFTDFVFPEGTGKVHSRVLEKCKQLMTVTLPAGVTEIGAHAFENCSGLSAIVLPETCQSIGASAFAYSGLTTIAFPQKMTDIDSEAFRFCKKLVRLDLPQGIISVRANLCEECDELVSVTIPEGVLEVRAHAFQNCGKLSSVSIPHSLKSIGSSAFRSCHSLRQITLPRWCLKEKNSFKSTPVTISHYEAD